MKSLSPLSSVSRIVAVLSLVVAGSAMAQDSGITTSTDPAKAAAVEQRAEQLRSQQQASPAPAPAARHARKHAPKHARKHMKPRHHKKGAMKPGAPAKPAPAPAPAK